MLFAGAVGAVWGFVSIGGIFAYPTENLPRGLSYAIFWPGWLSLWAVGWLHGLSLLLPPEVLFALVGAAMSACFCAIVILAVRMSRRESEHELGDG